MSYCGRYAPSPTGNLHLGNARTALVAYWRARQQNGEFIMRIEDLDSARSKADKVATNLAELEFLGIKWTQGPDFGGINKPYLQSQRHDLYQDALSKLIKNKQIFECYLSRKDLREISSAPHGQMPIYGQKERELNQKIKASKIAESKQPSLRFFVNTPEVEFEDILYGKQEFTVGDFIVKRADNEWAYQLAVVVDDIAMGITEVVRGADLLESTAAQILLYQALGAKIPKFMHLPLLNDKDGRMAKRKGSLTISELKNKGIKAERIVGLLAYSLGLVEKLR
ncbi:MAG TPA: tRNA glutamyl-Q(34) synthetase GluQRS, partial [Trueperaceae bacterium]|nr:tRNA glutamyl-Q(34) synthetase GluQRS [Trueperaceae bacterium]